MTTMQYSVDHPPPHCGFHFREGWLYCDDVRISDLGQQLQASGVFPATPVFVYSRRQLEDNVQQYRSALHGLPVAARLNFSLKANFNLQILKLLQELGCGATLVSGTEMRLAMMAGFEPAQMLLNGSGKTRWEVEAAVRAGVMLNVDSDFDLQQLLSVCRELALTARALLRVNLDIDPKVHQYVSTGKAGSKFGLDSASLAHVMEALTASDCPLQVIGLHCHLGSTINTTDVLRECVQRLLALRQDLKSKGLHNLQLLNIGGGLGIEYMHYRDETKPYRLEVDEVKSELARMNGYIGDLMASEKKDERVTLFQAIQHTLKNFVSERISCAEMDRCLKELLVKLKVKDLLHREFPVLFQEKQQTPSPGDLVRAVADLFEDPKAKDITVIVEPGRSIVGNAAALITTVVGCKSSGNTWYMVIDGSMTDVIRPSLYGAYHHIQPVGPNVNAADLHIVDVVGPVCESGDFLGKDRLLPLLPSGEQVAVFDTGAYCSSMASNYNLRLRPAEVLVEGDTWRLIRKPDILDDILRPYLLD